MTTWNTFEFLNPLFCYKLMKLMVSSKKLPAYILVLYNIVLFHFLFIIFLLLCLNFNILIPTPFLIKSLLFSDVFYQIQYNAQQLTAGVVFAYNGQEFFQAIKSMQENSFREQWGFFLLQTPDTLFYVAEAFSAVVRIGITALVPPGSHPDLERWLPLHSIFSDTTRILGLLNIFFGRVFRDKKQTLVDESHTFAEKITDFTTNFSYLTPESYNLVPSSVSDLCFRSYGLGSLDDVTFRFYGLVFPSMGSLTMFSHCVCFTQEDLRRSLLLCAANGTLYG